MVIGRKSSTIKIYIWKSVGYWLKPVVPVRYFSVAFWYFANVLTSDDELPDTQEPTQKQFCGPQNTLFTPFSGRKSKRNESNNDGTFEKYINNISQSFSKRSTTPSYCIATYNIAFTFQQKSSACFNQNRKHQFLESFISNLNDTQGGPKKPKKKNKQISNYQHFKKF